MEIRFQLTPDCNFGCFFCHNEGIENGPACAEYQLRRTLPSVDDLLRLVREALEQGCTDLTFTGGEPLLVADRLFACLAVAAAHETPPSVTVVTNGAQWTEAATQALLAYPGPRKVHVSFHAFEPDLFHQIIRRPARLGLFGKTQATVRELVAAGIPVKLNHVLLRGTNADPRTVLHSIAQAEQLGVQAIKFIELLVTEANWQQHAQYCDVTSLAPLLKPIATLEKDDGRRMVFRHHARPDFRIELTKCTCRLGCASCLTYRDRTVGSDLSLYPCFVQGSAGLSLREPGLLAQALATGDRVIQGYAERFGASSPILIDQDQFVHSRSEALFELPVRTPLTEARLDHTLAGQGFTRVSIRTLHRRFFWPRDPGPDWLAFHRVLRVAVNPGEVQGAALIYTDNAYLPEGGVFTTRMKFRDAEGGLKFPSPEAAYSLLERLDFVAYLDETFEIHRYALGEREVDLTRGRAFPTLRLDPAHLDDPAMRTLLEQLEARPIGVPLPQWLLNQAQGERDASGVTSTSPG
jgi:molybdenum cofactor biosynthesis enzyme MoaA